MKVRGKKVKNKKYDEIFELTLKNELQDFTDTDPWRALRIQSEFVEGFDALSQVGPAVSI